MSLVVRWILLHRPINTMEQITVTVALEIGSDPCVEMDHELVPLLVVGVGESIYYEPQFAARVKR